MAIAFALIAGVMILFVQLVYRSGVIAVTEAEFIFNDFLSEALNIIIAIEFVRMLCKHTPDAIVEMLMFAGARQLIVSHPTGLELLFGILAIGVLFLVRRYLLTPQAE